MIEKCRFLVIEDDQLTSMGLGHLLKDFGSVQFAYSFLEANEFLKNDQFDIVFIDLDLEKDLLGLELVHPFSQKGSYSVVVTARDEDEHIEKAYVRGCKDYLSKPFKKRDLEYILKKYQFSKKRDLYRRVFSENFITQDEKILAQLQKVNEMLVTSGPIFIKGPTGTGKTLMAKLLKEILYSEEAPFIHLNCSEIPQDLIESELFGYEKGAFSGADKNKKGLLELADKGVLFLDEIATMPMPLQQKLLKAIDEKKFFRLGGEKVVSSNFRIISATCENLEEMVRKKDFREDLFFRISGHTIELTPLSERKFDIDHLVKHFMKVGRRRVFIDPDVMGAFVSYEWPGNIRELKKEVEILMAKENGIVLLQDLPAHVRGNYHPCQKVEIEQKEIPQEEKPSDIEKESEDIYLSQIEVVKEKGLKGLLEKIEEDMVQVFYDRNNKKVRKTLDDLKISNSLFYKVMDRLKK